MNLIETFIVTNMNSDLFFKKTYLKITKITIVSALCSIFNYTSITEYQQWSTAQYLYHNMNNLSVSIAESQVEHLSKHGWHD